MADNQEDRIAALEAKVHELDALVNLALRLIALEKPVSAMLERFGATDVENRAVHTFLDEVARRAEQGGMYAPSFAGFVERSGGAASGSARRPPVHLAAARDVEAGSAGVQAAS